jgi:sugar phosphate isomerase/epimerase
MQAKLIAMNNPHRDLETELRYLLGFNIDGVELTAESPCSDIDAIMKVSSELLGRCLIGHTRGDFRFGHKGFSQRKQAIDDFKRYLDLFRELNIPLVNLHPDADVEGSSVEALRSRNVEAIALLSEYAVNLGLELMVENQPPFCGADDFHEIFQAAPAATILLDIAHAAYLVAEHEPLKFLSVHRDRIRHIHLSDNNGIHDDHLFIGRGKLKFTEYLQYLNDFTAKGVLLSLESFRVEDRAGIRIVNEGEERTALLAESIAKVRELSR